MVNVHEAKSPFSRLIDPAHAGDTILVAKDGKPWARLLAAQAFPYRKYLAQCDARKYLDAEYRASRRRYGVWQVPGGITRPWDLRRGRTARSGGTSGSVPGGRRNAVIEIQGVEFVSVTLAGG